MLNAGRIALAACAGVVFALSSAPAQPTAGPDPLIGLWASDTTFGPAARGELTITRAGSRWRARIARSESRFRTAGDSVRFGFAGSIGEFRGVLTDNGRAITGFWVEPDGPVQGPRGRGSSLQAFASPLVLRRARRDTWRGTVRPLEDRFTLYLRIFRSADGSLVGAFRNPQINSRGGGSQFRVIRDGDSLRFSARPDTTMPEVRLGASLARSPDRLRLFWPDLDRALELTRRTPSQAAEFYPRPPSETTYVYRTPPMTEDGWPTAPAGDVGMDEAVLARLVQRLITVDPTTRRPALIHSLLVARRGKLVLEEYFFGFDRDMPHDMRSAGKTFGSVMLGAAMMRGARLGPETRVYSLLAGMGPFANADPRKSQLTLAHLMTHTSGLACDDNDNESPGNEGTMQAQREQPDWWKYTLDLPMAHDPGTRYAYCSANSNLIGAALTNASGIWLPELFERTVARPLQFGPYHWNLMPTGEGYLGGGAFVRPRDLLKIGQLYLDGGVWHGRRIVDSSWVRRSTTPYVEISEVTTGLDSSQFRNSYNPGGADGYAWHLYRLQANGRTYREYEASGNGGQLLIVLPELDLVIVFTAGNYSQGGIWNRFRDQIVPGEIIPAVRTDP